LDQDKDRDLVEALARLADELVVYRQALADKGALLEEPVQNARGEVLGTKWSPNPAEQQIRRAVAQSKVLWDCIGLSPQARARLPHA
jgi:phage terminase small subunit